MNAVSAPITRQRGRIQAQTSYRYSLITLAPFTCLLSHCQLAVFLIWLYVKLFSVDVSEAERGGDLGAYRSLGAFFSRRLRPGLRPVSPASESGLVSPADGTVTHRGPFAGGFLQQVKGVHYSINYVSSL